MHRQDGKKSDALFSPRGQPRPLRRWSPSDAAAIHPPDVWTLRRSIRSLPPLARYGDEHLCTSTFRLYSDRRIQTFFAPFDFVNRSAKVAIIGITPGFQQMEIAFRAARLGAVTALRILRRVCRGRVALVGDASGSVDSLTGEGLGLAFRQAEALAEAVAGDDLTRYQAAHRRINRVPEIMSRLLLALENRHKLRRRAILALAKEPRLFERLLAAHTGAFSPLNIGFGSLLRLGRRLIAESS